MNGERLMTEERPINGELSTGREAVASGAILAGHFRETDTYAVRRPNGRSDYLLTYTLAGEGFFIGDGREVRCRAGDVTLLKPGVPQHYGTVPGQAWHFVWVHFSAQTIEDRFLPEERLFIRSIDNESARKRIYRAFRHIQLDSREQGAYWTELVANAIRDILLLAQRADPRQDPRIADALHWLSRHMREPVRVGELARAIGVSPSRLSHLFKEQTGMSIIEALNRMRTRQAAGLLAHTERTAAEIALDAGYSNYNHFIAQFRKRYGMSPSDYRKRQRETRPNEPGS